MMRKQVKIGRFNLRTKSKNTGRTDCVFTVNSSVDPPSTVVI